METQIHSDYVLKDLTHTNVRCRHSHGHMVRHLFTFLVSTTCRFVVFFVDMLARGELAFKNMPAVNIALYYF